MIFKNLLIKNCTILNPETKKYFFGNILIEDGIIAKISKEAKFKDAKYDSWADEIDAEGRLTVPGLTDMHAHVYNRNDSIGVEPDEYCVKRGVTLVVDAGTSGTATFEDFKSNIIDQSDTTVKAFINLSSTGLQNPGREFRDIGKLDYLGIPELYKRYKNEITGIKVRISENIAGKNAGQLLKYAVQTGEKTRLPVMVHPSNSLLLLDEILGSLHKGDIFTHCFHNSNTGILDADLKIKKCVRNALDKGIIFDVGHGAGSFSYKVAEASIKQGFLPHTISTDLHAKNPKRPDLPYVLSKFLALGMSIEDAIERATVGPIRALNLKKNTKLAVGGITDFVIFDIKTGNFNFEDSYGYRFAGNKLICPLVTVYGKNLFRIEDITNNKW